MHWFSSLCKLTFKSLHEFHETQAEDLAECAQLNDVQPPIPSFDFAYQRLRLAELLCQVHLGDTRLFPDFLEQPEHDRIFPGVDGSTKRTGVLTVTPAKHHPIAPAKVCSPRIIGVQPERRSGVETQLDRSDTVPAVQRLPKHLHTSNKRRKTGKLQGSPAGHFFGVDLLQVDQLFVERNTLEIGLGRLLPGGVIDRGKVIPQKGRSNAGRNSCHLFARDEPSRAVAFSLPAGRAQSNQSASSPRRASRIGNTCWSCRNRTLRSRPIKAPAAC